MRRNLASSLFLTERDAEYDDNAPKVPGRVVTTLQKAKEVRGLVEKCVTIARRSLKHTDAAQQFATEADRGSDEWKQWRTSDQWQKWNQAIAPAVAARRRALQLLGDKEAVQILFDEIAPRFADRPGGYTRVLRLAEVRLGDGGQKAILEFVGQHDRVTEQSERPAFGDDEPLEDSAAEVDEAVADAENTAAEETAETGDAETGDAESGEAEDGEAEDKAKDE